METSNRKSTRIILSLALALSLAGITSMEAISKAFADDEMEIIQETVELQENEGLAADAVEKPAEDDSEDDVTLDENTSNEDAYGEDATFVAAEQPDEDEADAPEVSPFAIKAPEKRYVYEYVYGVFSDELTVASNSNGSWGALISATKGEIVDPSIEIATWDADEVANGNFAFVPFRQNGKFGLFDLSAKAIAIPATFDIAGSSSGPYNSVTQSNEQTDGRRWGFIQLGAANSEGVYPNAQAIFTVSGKQAFSVPLPNYAKYGTISTTSPSKNGEADWYVGWSTNDANSGPTGNHRSLSYIEKNGTFELAEKPEIAGPGTGSVGYKTFDGHTVYFKEIDGKVTFSVADASGNTTPSKALATNQTSIGSFSTVSNIIQVRSSNGYNYQYFTLDGNLLQNMNNQSLTGLGNYVSYGRANFETQKPEQVFLDTSDSCREAKQIPCIEVSFPNAYAGAASGKKPIFECLTENNKIQRYDDELRLIKEFDPTLDLAGQKEKGYDPRWSISDFGNDAWLVNESVWTQGGWTANRIDAKSQILKGDSTIEPASLGFSTPYIPYSGMVYGSVYMMDESDSNELRVFDTSFSLVKSIDLSGYLSTSQRISSLGVSEAYTGNHGLRDLKLSYVSLTLRGENDSYAGTKTIHLDSGFNDTGYEDIAEGANGIFFAKKDGKWGFVNSKLAPLSKFAYDWIYNSGSNGFFTAEENGKYRQFDGQLRDVFGFAYDSLESIGATCTQIMANGNTSIYDSNFKQVDLHGYKPIENPDYKPCHATRARILPDGSTMLYLKNSAGKVGAINTSGDIVIPFEYDDYAESVGSVESSHIMFKDAQGWFFVAAADLAASDPNDECATQGHDYEATEYAPTCTTNGYTQMVCKRCGNGYRDDSTNVPALGHDYLVTEAATVPTCTEGGQGAKYECSRCGNTKQDANIPSLGGHTDFRWGIITFPTCTEEGFQVRTCSRCGLHEEEIIARRGHSWSYPTWEWASDFSSATASMTCLRSCGETKSIDGEMAHTPVDDGVRHSAQFEMNGRRYQDGRLALGWEDENGIARSLLVKGEPVADGFYVWPHELSLDDDPDTTVEINIDPVSEGGIFDALVSKIGSGWPAGTFDVRLNIDGEDVHDGFGTLKFAFPAGVESAGKKATIYHCHKNDRDNISAHDLLVSEDGNVVLSGIVDLSTFMMALQSDEVPTPIDDGTAAPTAPSPATPATPSLKTQGSQLAQTGDSANVLMGGMAAIAICGAVAALVGAFAVRRKRNGQ